MKILAQINPLSGSDYHRKLVPLKYLKADFAEELNSELVSKYDILWISRNCNISAASLSVWKHAFGVKIVYDLDDSLTIPPTYPGAKNHIQSNPLVKDKLFLADWITVSTKELYEEVVKLDLNKNITIIPNRLDFKNIKLKEESWEEFKERKIKVGFIGAYTHYQDWKSIKGWMNTLVRNNKFRQECQFVMLGYTKSVHKYWVEFADLGKFGVALPPDQYLRLFEEIDIILCPLVDNQLNRCKSSLRILESAVGNSICILDKLYQSKTDLPGGPYGLIVQQDKQWLSYVLDLIEEKDVLYEMKNRFGKSIREIDFETAVDLRKDVCKKVLKVEEEPLRYHLYSIKYKDEQPVEYFSYFNKVKTIQDKSYLFEYQPIIEIVDKIKQVDYNDWVGIFSWKFPIKTKLFKKKVQKLLDENQGYDCINFCRPLGQPYLKFTEKQHPGFMNLFVKICKDLDLPFSEPKNTIYSNFFCLRADHYEEYVESVLKPAINLLETKYKEEAWLDSNYKGGLNKELLKEYTGLDHYTFHTFILERLIGQWIDKKKFKTYNYV